jgi:heme/copper-type cytochrome/quinol oxidase subunit 2
VLLAASQAFSKTFGLIVTFGGIGLIVNGLIVYIAIQIRGERQQNEEYRAERGQRFGA